MIGLKENVIVGRLIPAGTGGAAREIRSIASNRDAKIIEQKRLAEEEKEKLLAAESEEVVSAANDVE